MGMGLATPGQHYTSRLTNFNDEERLGWQLQGWVNDAFSVELRDAVHLHNPVLPIFESSGRHFGRQFAISKLTFTCMEAIAAQAFSALGQEERNVVGLAVLRKWFGPDWGLQRHADVLCVFVPLPLAFACVRSAWHWLVFSAATVRRHTRLFSDWPPPDFFRLRGRLNVGPQPITQSNGLVAARLRLCASDLRSWAPQLAQHDTSMEGDLGVSTTLQSHVQLLEDLAWSMGGALHDAECARKHPASQLIDCMLLAALLKNRGSLRTVFSRAVAIVFPGPIAAAANARINAGVVPVSEASTTRTRQAFDIAFALHMRSVFFAHGMKQAPSLAPSQCTCGEIARRRAATTGFCCTRTSCQPVQQRSGFLWPTRWMLCASCESPVLWLVMARTRVCRTPFPAARNLSQTGEGN